MTIFILTLSIILSFILVCYMTFNPPSGENSLFEPKKWYNDWDNWFRIVKYPYGYVVEQKYGKYNIWHHQYKYIFKNGRLIETISHFKTYDEAKQWLFEEHKELKYEHL